MRHLGTASLTLLAFAALHLGCRDEADEPMLERAAVSDRDGCRSYAALGVVHVGGEPGEARCTFDPGSLEHRCETVTADGRLSSVSEYASSADFIEAGRHMGKLTSLRETRTENGDVRRLSYSYDELGRVTRSVEISRGDRVVTRYADYDAQGRPRQARAESARDVCGAWVSSIEYADVARTVVHRSQPRDAERCGFGVRTLVERYDASGSRASVESSDGAGVSRLFSARQVATTERVCL